MGRAAPQQEKDDRADNRYSKGEAIRQIAHRFCGIMLALPIGQADERLTPVADALHQQHDHSRNIADRRIAGHSDIPAENHGALIEQDQSDIGRIGQAKGGQSHT